MGMAQVLSRPRSEIQFLSDVGVIVLSANITGVGVSSVRVVPNGFTFVCVSLQISTSPSNVSRPNAEALLNFPNGTVRTRAFFPARATNQDFWQIPSFINVKGIEFIGDGIDDIEFETLADDAQDITFTLIGYEKRT